LSYNIGVGKKYIHTMLSIEIFDFLRSKLNHKIGATKKQIRNGYQ
jgi:hypothetical protein